MNVTLSGKDALTVKYAIALARLRFPELAEMPDDDVLDALIARGLEREGRATA